MNSLKTILLTLATGVASFISTQSFAQKAYVKVGGNYNFGIGASMVKAQVTGTHYTNNSETLTYEQVKINYGEGMVLNAAAGYYFTEHFGLEMGIGLLKGKTTKIENRMYREQYALTEGVDYETSAPMTFLQPSLIATFGTGAVRPFGKLGLIFASGEITEKEHYSWWSYTEDYESKYTGGRGFGLQGTAGVDFKANKNITFYLETVFNNLNYAPEKWELTQADKDGESLLPRMPLNETEIIFSENYTVSYDRDGNTNKDMPAQNVQQYFAMNSWGLGFGMKVTF